MRENDPTYESNDVLLVCRIPIYVDIFVNGTPVVYHLLMFCFAEFERDMIVQRTQEGKAIAKTKPGFTEGRPRKYTDKQIEHALELKKEYSYKQVSEVTGISIPTIYRAKKSRLGESFSVNKIS